MSVQLLFVGLQSLKPMAPAVVFLGFALLLVALPRRASAPFGSAIGLVAAFSAALVLLTAAKIDRRGVGDLDFSPLAQCTPWWFVIVAPTIIGCLHRSNSLNRGMAVGGLLLAGGALCFAAAAGSVPLLLLALMVALVGTCAVPLAAASEDSFSANREFSDASKIVAAVSMVATLFVVGASFVLWNDPRLRLDFNAASPAGIFGSVLSAVALFSFVGLAPMSSWFRRRGVGVCAAVNVLLLFAGSVALLKLSKLLQHQAVATVLWTWAMASLIRHLGGLLAARDLATVWANQWGFFASIASAGFVLGIAGANVPLQVGSIGVLAFLSVVGPAAAAVLESCQLSASGAIGKPSGLQSWATNGTLLALVGLPLTLGFWALKLLGAAGLSEGPLAGLRQLTVLGLISGVAVGGWATLRGWAALEKSPALPPMDEDCRWLAFSGIYGLAVACAIGVWPNPFFSQIEAVLRSMPAQLPVDPLKP